MGESKLRGALNGQAEKAIEDAKQSGKQIELQAQQIAVVLACERLAMHVKLEAAQLTQWYGEKDAAKELLSAADHIAKFSNRYLADTQKRVIIPKIEIASS